MFKVAPSIAAEIATSRLKRSTLASTSRISIIPSHSWFLCLLMAGHFKKICTGVYRYFWSQFPQTAGWLNLGMVINFAEYRTHDFPLTRCFASLKSTVYPKKYAHDFCFAVLCCGYTLTDFPIPIRLTSLVLWQSNDCPSASKATLMNMDKYFMWIHYERLHNHNKAKHNKTVCIFLGIYCTCGPQRHITKAASEKSVLTHILMSPYFDFVCS